MRNKDSSSVNDGSVTGNHVMFLAFDRQTCTRWARDWLRRTRQIHKLRYFKLRTSSIVGCLKVQKALRDAGRTVSSRCE